MPIYLSICESDIHFKKLLLEHVNRALNLDLIACYNNGYELINRIKYQQNNFLIIDVFTPILTGLEAIKILRKKQNKTPIIAYTLIYQEEVKDLLDQYEHVYYCQKNSLIIFKILSAIQSEDLTMYNQHIQQWKTYNREITENSMQPSAIYTPSSIELQIINYACKGLTNKEIGEKVHLSGRTIEMYIKKLTEKFKVKNKIQLITYCVERHLHQYN